MLLRDDESAKKLAHTLGDARAIVMRGNGCILTGATVEEAIVMAFYLEEAATTELAVMALRPRRSFAGVFRRTGQVTRGIIGTDFRTDVGFPYTWRSGRKQALNISIILETLLVHLKDAHRHKELCETSVNRFVQPYNGSCQSIIQDR